jgi:RNA polymerase-binding transcription factor DksA
VLQVPDFHTPYLSTSPMAATKNTPKSAPVKKAGKSAVKPAKPAAKPAQKAANKVAAPKKTAPVKKVAPAKKTAPVKKALPAKKTAPVKKSAPAKKTASPKKYASPAKKPAPLKKSAPAPKVPVKTASRAKAAAATVKTAKPAEKKVSMPAATAAKAPVKKSGSTLVKSPAPAAPLKPRFVPPVAQPQPTGPVQTPGSNGSHSPAFIQKQRQRLLDLRDDLVDSMSGMTRDTIRNAPEGSEASGSGQHQGDAGSDAYDRDFALSVLAKEQDALYEIEQALRRIQAGNYGICEISSRKIPQARLEAIPFARLTVECQAQWEKEYGKRRFRPSNEVGFSGGNYIEDEDSESVSLDEDED